MCRLHISIIGKMRSFTYWRARSSFRSANRTTKGTPGTMVFLPHDVRHSYTIESEQSRMLILLTPAGLERWFKEFSVPAQAMALPPADETGYHEVQSMLGAALRYGIEFVG
jgi:hypothetical protein